MKLLLSAILGLALLACDSREVAANWSAQYADNRASNGEIRLGDPYVCPDHITTTRFWYMYFIPISTGKTTVLVPITVYHYDRHDLLPATCVVVVR